MNRYVGIILLVLFLTSVAVSGCGGGGSGSNSGGSPTAAPIAAPDLYPLNVGATLTQDASGGVLSNDRDPQGLPLTAVLVNEATHGALSLNADGSFQYINTDAAVGKDSFTYKASNGARESNVVSVTLTINAIPVAVPNAYTVNAGDTLMMDALGGVLSNDSDPQGNALTAVLVDDVSHGTLNLNADGSFQYTHTDTGIANDSFTYKANNGNQNSNAVTVTLAINAPPTAGNSCDKVGLNPATLSGNLSMLVSDPKGDTIFTYAITQQGAKGFTSVDSTTGLFTYTPDPDARGEDSFTYEARDILGATDIGTFKVIIGKTRIMPLGDSITAGITGPETSEPLDPADRIGYRKKLYDDLVAAGFEVDFVGSQQGGQNQGIGDPDHEGYEGMRDDDLANSQDSRWVQTLLATKPADIVLLHIGSNDLNVKPPDVDANEVLKKILQDIDDGEASNNHVTVFLAQITDRETQFFSFPSPYSPNPDVLTFNNNITQVANARISNGDDIVIVDHFSELSYPNDLTLGDSGLRVHPTPGLNGGYEKMANTWFNKLVASGKIPTCP